MTRYQNLLREYERMRALTRPLTKCERVRICSVLGSLDELTPASVVQEQMGLLELMVHLEQMKGKFARLGYFADGVVLQCGAPVRAGSMVSIGEDGKCYPARMTDPTTDAPDAVWKVVR